MMLFDTVPTIRVIIADDHPIVRQGICNMLNATTAITVVGEASNGKEALHLIDTVSADVVVLDINMPELSGIDILRLRTEVTTPCYLILTGYSEPEYAFQAISYGAKGFILKDETPTFIRQAVTKVACGEVVFSPQVIRRMISNRNQPALELTKRETEILCMVAKGKTEREILAELNIKANTFKSHLAAIYRKLPNVSSRAEAVAWAWQNRLVQSDCLELF